MSRSTRAQMPRHSGPLLWARSCYVGEGPRPSPPCPSSPQRDCGRGGSSEMSPTSPCLTAHWALGCRWLPRGQGLYSPGRGRAALPPSLGNRVSRVWDQDPVLHPETTFPFKGHVRAYVQPREGPLGVGASVTVPKGLRQRETSPPPGPQTVPSGAPHPLLVRSPGPAGCSLGHIGPWSGRGHTPTSQKRRWGLREGRWLSWALALGAAFAGQALLGGRQLGGRARPPLEVGASVFLCF